MRKLASVQTVSRITPIDGADAIEVVDVLGWHVVVKKGELKTGELVVYFEVDSILPERPEFEFLRERSKFRIKTIRLRGQVSQGICFPLSILPAGDYAVGDDVTDILGVKLYEPPETGEDLGEGIGEFPSHLVTKTDEERVQNRQALLSHNVGRLCYITEKFDGVSASYVWKDGSFVAASRNHLVNVDDPDDNVWIRVATQYNLREKMRKLNRNIAIQCEIVGKGIQSNKYKFNRKELFVFNVIDVESREHYSLDEMIRICNELELKTVPILDTNFALVDSVDEMVELSKGKSVLNDVIREGIVVRPIDGARFSFKCLNPDFLLKYE